MGGGGYAIALDVGQPFREHENMDVSSGDVTGSLARLLAEWDCRPVDPEGLFRSWAPDAILPLHVHDVWCREGTDAPWRFSLLIDEADGDMWYARRDSTVRKPLADLTARQPGTPPFLAPDIQLYHKAKHLRAKDEQDLDMALPILTARQRTWLAERFTGLRRGAPVAARIDG